MLYLVRCGEATHDAAAAGATVEPGGDFADAPLTPAGRYQAETLKPEIDALNPFPKCALVSPLRRACETADLSLPPTFRVFFRPRADLPRTNRGERPRLPRG